MYEIVRHTPQNIQFIGSVVVVIIIIIIWRANNKREKL